MHARLQPWHLIAGIGVLTPTLSLIAGLGLAVVLPVVAVFGAMPLLARARAWRNVAEGAVARLMALAMAWLALTLLWATHAADGLDIGWRVAVLLLLGFALITAVQTGPQPAMDRRLVSLLVSGFGVALTLALLEGLTGGFLIEHYYLTVAGREAYFLHDLNRGLCTLALLVWPVALALALYGKPGMAWGLIALTLAVTVPLDSLSASVALTAGMICTAGVIVARAWAFRLLAVVAILGCGAIPLFFSLWDTQAMAEALSGLPENALHRLYIWEFTADSALERPWLGWGLNASRHIPGGDALLWADKAQLPVHPHNSVLQLWLEGGAVGVLFYAILLIAILHRIAHLPVSWTARAFSAGLLVAYVVIGLLAFSLWQNWWIAAGFLSAAMMAFMLRAAEAHTRVPAGNTPPR